MWLLVLNVLFVSLFAQQATTADLSLIKDDCQSEVRVGDSPAFTFSISNAGTSNAVNVTMVDRFPDLYKILSVSSPCILNGSDSVVCSWAVIASGASVSTTVRYALGPSAQPGLWVTNCASVSSSTSDASTTNNEACDSNLIIGVATTCSTYNGVCSTNSDCCSPLQCKRHALGCGNATGASLRCVAPGGTGQIDLYPRLRGTGTTTTTLGSNITQLNIPTGSAELTFNNNIFSGEIKNCLTNGTLDTNCSGTDKTLRNVFTFSGSVLCYNVNAATRTIYYSGRLNTFSYDLGASPEENKASFELLRSGKAWFWGAMRDTNGDSRADIRSVFYTSGTEVLANELTKVEEIGTVFVGNQAAVATNLCQLGDAAFLSADYIVVGANNTLQWLDGEGQPFGPTFNGTAANLLNPPAAAIYSTGLGAGFNREFAAGSNIEMYFN